MAAEIFSDEWATLWSDSINANAAYKEAAAKWEGAVALVMTADPDMGIPEQRTVVADLWHGDSRSAEAVQGSPGGDVPYVIQASPATWKNVLSGKTDPIVGLMGGKLKLTRGSLFALLPYAKAAKELVRSARKVETTYPEGWD